RLWRLNKAFAQTCRLFDLGLAFLHSFGYQRTVQPETVGFLREDGTKVPGRFSSVGRAHHS
ncbi:hypothetical protein, partial [Brucella abortus]